jgi:hypothetical protein
MVWGLKSHSRSHAAEKAGPDCEARHQGQSRHLQGSRQASLPEAALPQPAEKTFCSRIPSSVARAGSITSTQQTNRASDSQPRRNTLLHAAGSADRHARNSAERWKAPRQLPRMWAAAQPLQFQMQLPHHRGELKTAPPSGAAACALQPSLSYDKADTAHQVTLGGQACTTKMGVDGLSLLRQAAC